MEAGFIPNGGTMNIRRLLPVVGALLLVGSAFGGPALAQEDSSDGGTDYDYEKRCEERYDDPARQEQCKQAYEDGFQEYDGSDSESDDDSDSDWDRSGSSKAWSPSHDDGESRHAPPTLTPKPRPVVMEIPADIAPDVDERREFFQEQAQEHREFHQTQQEERTTLFENQSEDRREFLRDLVQRCLNVTAPADANVSTDDVQTRIDVEVTNQTAREECLKDLRAYLMEQQEERQELLEDQREDHEAFHEDLREERQAFIQEQREDAEERAEEARQRWSQQQSPDRPAEAGPMGAFQASDGHVDGRYVSFNYTSNPAALADVSIKGVPLFDAAALDGTAQERFRGVHFALSGANGSLVIHDNPAVAFQIRPADDTTWVLNLAGHLTVNATDDDERWRVTDGEAFHGALLFEDDPSYDPVNKSFTGDEGVRFVVVPEMATPGGTPGDGPGMTTTSEEAEVSNAKREAMINGSLGAEVDLTSSDEGIEDQTVLYDDLEVTLEEKEPGKVRFVVDGELETGRTVVVNADPGLFEGDRLSVSYHDIYENGTEEEIPIRLANTVQDVMNPNDDSTPEYLPAKGAQGWQVMVSIPHFSAHAVTIQSVTAQAPPSIMAGALAAAGFLVLAGANLFRRGGGRA